MGRKREKPMRPAGAVPVGDVSGVGEVSAEELAKSDGMEVDRQLREWVSRENPESLTVLVYIYKYDHPSTGESKTLCDRVEGEVPDPHAIGQTYGGGRYMLMVSIPQGENQDRKVKALRFRLHTRYDEIAARRLGQPAAGAAAPAVGAVPAAAPGSSLREGLEVVRMVVDMLRPIMESQRAAPPDMGKLLEGQYDMMAGVLRKSLADSQALIGEIQRARLEGEPAPEDDPEPDFMAKIMPLVDRFLPVLLGGGPAGKAAAAAVSAMPEVRRVIGNTAELQRVIAWLDRQQGREKTDRLLGVLRVRRPHNGAARAVPAAARVPAVAGVKG